MRSGSPVPTWLPIPARLHQSFTGTSTHACPRTYEVRRISLWQGFMEFCV